MFKSVMSEMKELKQTVPGLIEPLSDGELSDEPRHEEEQNASGERYGCWRQQKLIGKSFRQQTARINSLGTRH